MRSFAIQSSVKKYFAILYSFRFLSDIASCKSHYKIRVERVESINLSTIVNRLTGILVPSKFY